TALTRLHHDTSSTPVHTTRLSLVLWPFFFFFLLSRPPPRSTLFPYTTLFRSAVGSDEGEDGAARHLQAHVVEGPEPAEVPREVRSEEHTSELQSRFDLVCRLLLEKKKKIREKISAIQQLTPPRRRNRDISSVR